MECTPMVRNDHQGGSEGGTYESYVNHVISNGVRSMCVDNSYGCSAPYINYRGGDGTDNFFGSEGTTFESPSSSPRKFTKKGLNRIRPNGVLAKYALPCQSEVKYDYDNCFNFFANGCYNSCQFVEQGDIEDFLNNEKRKEKSRDAARCRRSRETEIFTDLANALPLTQEQISQLDKASIMRLAISYLRVRDMMNLVPEVPTTEKDSKIIAAADETAFMKFLEGFLLALSPDGDFIYLSENVSDYLGISQVDLMGQNVFEYSHPCDHDEIREILSSKGQDDTETPKSFFIRLKCTLTSKGRSVNLKSATYKVIHCTGHIVKNEEKSNMKSCLVAVGQPIPHPSNIETPLPKQTFLTKHGLDMKFTHADDKVMTDFLGYNSDDLIGKSFYEYHHAMDSEAICSAYKCLFSKGQCETSRYRFLAKTGGYVWVVTQATLIYDKVQKPQSVVCVNYVISGIESGEEIYSATQYTSIKSEQCSTSSASCSATTSKTDNSAAVPVVEKVLESNNQTEPEAATSSASPSKPAPTTTNKPIITTEQLFASYDPGTIVPPLPLSRPQTATTKIFAPRTKDMNKGFLTFSDEEPGLTLLKDEPEDLTHLAPEAGDVCVPLDQSFLTDIFLDDILLRDNFGPLLNECPNDPFTSYRDSYDPSPQLLSPNLSKNSDCSLPSLNSPGDSLTDEDQMSSFMNLPIEDESELAMKAPYIPMNTTEDLPLLTNDLMWSSNEGGDKSIPDSNSSLAQLLSSSVNKHSLKINDHVGRLLPDNTVEDLYNDKNLASNWINTSTTPKSNQRPSASTKRSNSSLYDTSNKRTRNETKEPMSSELLQQLMSNNHHRGRPKGKSNWLLDSGGQKAACISQPSDSVLMNLLDDPLEGTNAKLDQERLSQKRIQLVLDKDKEATARRNLIRKNSISLLDPDGSAIPSLLDLSQQDFEVNAPVNCLLLQGKDLLKALDINAGAI